MVRKLFGAAGIAAGATVLILAFAGAGSVFGQTPGTTTTTTAGTPSAVTSGTPSSGTPSAAATTPAASATTPAAAGTSITSAGTPTPQGTVAGVTTGPNTGTGPGSDSGPSVWLLAAGAILGLAGAGVLVTGARRRS